MQVNSDKKMRGRVMGILVLAVAVISIGNLLIGAVSQKIGAPNTLLCQGIIALIIAAVFSIFLTGDKFNKKEHFNY